MPVDATVSTSWKLAASPKLSPPQSERLVSRSRLLKQIDVPCSVVTIVGPPLAGKTCLAASWMHSASGSNRSHDILWYRIDDSDRDVATFFQLMNVVASKRILPHLKLPTYSAEVDVKNFTAAWLGAIFRMASRRALAFIFDDVHRLTPGTPLLLVLSKLARALKDEDRLILVSRREVPAPIIDAARRRQRLVRITDFTIDESEFTDFEQSTTQGAPLTRPAFQDALRQSGNWMEGLPLLPWMGAPARIVHETVAGLLADLDDEERAAVVATAYLQVGFDEDWTRLGGRAALAVLSKLERTTGLVRRLKNSALEKHEVVFEELKKWAEANAEGSDLIRARLETGRFLITRDEVFSGVELLLAAEAFEETRAAVLEQASHLIDRGKNTELIAIIDALPAEARTQPGIKLWAAYARLPFEPEQASDELAAIWLASAEELSVLERALAVNGEIYGAIATMRVDARMPLLIEAATALTVELTAVQEPMRSRLYIGRLVAVLLGAPTYDRHAAIRKEARDLLPDLTPESRLILGASLVTHLLWSEGDVDAARALHRQIAEQAQHPDAAYLPVLNWHVGALSLAFRDGNEQALTLAFAETKIFARQRGLEHRLAPAYWVATQAYAAFGNHDAATTTLNVHLNLIGAMSELHEHETHFLCGAIALGRGDLETAAREAAAGWSIADRHGAIQGRRQNAVVLAIARAFQGDASASAAIDEVAQVGRDTGNRIFLLHAALATAALARAKQRWKAFATAWKEVTRLTLVTGIKALTGINADAVGRLAHDALVRRIELEATARLIAWWRLLPPAGGPTNSSWPYRVHVNALGRGEIELIARDENGQPRSGQARQKTKRLLAMLISADLTTLSQQTLIDELWPEAPEAEANTSLRQQVRDLRKLTTYDGIIFENGSYRLNDRLIMSDVQRLEEAMQIVSDRRVEFQQRIAAFDRALQIYRGPLLPTDTSRIVKERRDHLAKTLKKTCSSFLRALARKDAVKALVRKRRLAKLF